MPQIIYTLAAIRDLQRLRAFLTPKNPQAARRAGEAIRVGLQVLASQPRLGRPVEDLPEPFREWPIGFGRDGYVVRYRIDGDLVTILVIRHGHEAGFP